MDEYQAELRSWENMWELSKTVAEKIRETRYKPELIITILRGGLVPAMNLSDILDIKDIHSLRVEHWGKTAIKNTNAEIKTPLTADLSGKKILLVDDIADTGESIKLALENIKKLNPLEVKTATLIYKKQSTYEPDYYGEKTDEWRWIIFPWNITEDLCTLTEKVSEKGEELTREELKNRLKREYNLIIDDRLLQYALDETRRRN